LHPPKTDRVASSPRAEGRGGRSGRVIMAVRSVEETTVIFEPGPLWRHAEATAFLPWRRDVQGMDGNRSVGGRSEHPPCLLLTGGSTGSSSKGDPPPASSFHNGPFETAPIPAPAIHCAIFSTLVPVGTTRGSVRVKRPTARDAGGPGLFLLRALCDVARLSAGRARRVFLGTPRIVLNIDAYFCASHSLRSFRHR
jgi:hypothetical protein